MQNKSKVILLPCSSYREELVYEELKKGLELLGGLEKLIKKEEKVLLKPNLLKKAEVEKAVITHPVIVGMFARLLKEYGCKNVILADSCGHGNTRKVIAGTGMDRYMEELHIPAVDFSEGIKMSYPEGVQAKEFMLSRELLEQDCVGTGMDRYMEELHIPAVDFSEGIKMSYPEGVQAKEFMLSRELLEQDCVISLCKMKTHALERITGAVKNSYGFVYGFYKAKGHTLYPSADSFARMLVDLNQCVGPRLYVMDGITAMEGNGPGSGDPVDMGVLLLSTDPVALDSVFCHLVHLKPQIVPTNYHGEKMGLGTWKKEEIEILTPDGRISMEEAVHKYGNSEFHVDRRIVKHGIWEKMAKALNIFQKKPYIEAEKCIRCGICVKSCPVPGKAVDFRDPLRNLRKKLPCAGKSSRLSGRTGASSGV